MSEISTWNIDSGINHVWHGHDNTWNTYVSKNISLLFTWSYVSIMFNQNYYFSMFFTVAHILAYNQVIKYSKYNIIAQEKIYMYSQIILIGTYFGL